MRGPILLLGMQGAGKGTVGRLLREETAAVHLSAGGLLRERVRRGGRWASEIDERIGRGLAVPEEISYGLLSEKLDSAPADRPLVLDGYPRDVSQAPLLRERLGGDAELVLLLNVVRPIAVDRLLSRLACAGCDETFGPGVPPLADGVCDGCGGRLDQRDDDTTPAIAKRLDSWSRNSGAIVAHYETIGRVSFIDASVPFEWVRERVLAAVGESRN